MLFLLVAGYQDAGHNLGEWLIESISDEHSALFADGYPRTIDFSVTLKRAKAPEDDPQQTATISNGNQFSNTA